MAELLGFRARGHTVGLLAPERASIFSEAAQHDLARATVAEQRWAFPFEVVRSARWLRAFRADVVNTHSSRDGWIVGLAARLARTPLVIRSRHIDVRYPNVWISRHAFAHLCDHVITTSDKQFPARTSKASAALRVNSASYSSRNCALEYKASTRARCGPS